MHKIVLLITLLSKLCIFAEETASNSTSNNLYDDIRVQLYNTSVELAFRLNRNQTDSNLIFSPFGLSNALTMLQIGAKSDTKMQLSSLLGVGRQYSNAFDVMTAHSRVLNSLVRNYERYFFRPAELGKSDVPQSKEGKGHVLSIASKVFIDKKFTALPRYEDLLRLALRSDIESIDFSDRVASVRAINEFVNSTTDGHIPKFVAALPGADLSILLTNAIYFKCFWRYEFDPRKTLPNVPFYAQPVSLQQPREEISKVTMMRRTHALTYLDVFDCHVVELPYTDDELSMVIISPYGASLDRFIERDLSTLKISRIEAWLKFNSMRMVNLQIPRMKFSSNMMLKEVLRDLGVDKAFSPEADFSGMAAGSMMVDDEEKVLRLSEVLQKSEIDVGEFGTEASSITAAVLTPQSAALPDASESEPAINLRLDAPFLFYIRHRTTGVILYFAAFKGGQN